MTSPFTITLTVLDASILRARARSSTAPHRDVIRARIVLAAARAPPSPNTEIAAEVGVHIDTVRKWRRRFAAKGLAGFEDLARSRRQRNFTPVQVPEIKALACTLPAETGRPLSRWSSAELATDAIKPWQHRSWILPRDPDFGFKAARGTLAYFAAYDVHHARVLGQIAPKTGIAPFRKPRGPRHDDRTVRLGSARRVFWVVDNGSSHNGARSVKRMKTAWPTATLVHLPIHASWLNQVEIYFSILQRKTINPKDFADLDQLSQRILGFQGRYDATATPFDWTYTRDDLTAFLQRLDLRDIPQTA